MTAAFGSPPSSPLEDLAASEGTVASRGFSAQKKIRFLSCQNIKGVNQEKAGCTVWYHLSGHLCP